MGTWNYVVNEKFTEEYGEGSLGRFADMLGDVAGRVRPGDRDGAMELLDAGFERLGMNMPKLTRDQLAENLTMAEHSTIVISDDSGRIIAEHALPGAVTSTDEERRTHVEPEDGDRPAYS